MGLLSGGHQGNEAIEQQFAVVRAGSCLGVVLDGESGDVQGSKALDDAVVEADVRDLDAAVSTRIEGRDGRFAHRSIHRETVVMGGDFDAARGHVLHRLVDAAVTVVELIGAVPEGAAEQLVPEADTKVWDTRV